MKIMVYSDMFFDGVIRRGYFYKWVYLHKYFSLKYMKPDRCLRAEQLFLRW